MERLASNHLFIAPTIETPWIQLSIILAGLLFTMLLSGWVVKFFVLPRNYKSPVKDPNGPRFESSTIIGKCENIIVFAFTLLGQESGLAIVFAAKALARSEDIKKNPGFFLGGTLVNIIWAMLISYTIRILVLGL